MDDQEPNLKVLHAFRRYLPISLNWAYRLIEATPGTVNHIYAHFFEKNNFYSPGWRFLDVGSPNLGDLYRRSGKDLFYKILHRGLAAKIRTQHVELVRNYIKENEIAVVHSHFAHFGYIMSGIIKDMAVKHVVSFYGYDYEKIPFKNPAFVQHYKELFQSAAAFICEGQHGVETLAKMGCPREKLHVVRLGFIPEKISFVERVKKKDSLQLVQIASITEKKGHFYTIRAFMKALKTLPDMTLTIVGSAKNEADQLILEDIKGQIREHHAEEKVKLISGIDYSALYDFLGQYDVFIHPSCYAADMDCEGGAPVVLLDAQATGMPVISTKHCDIPEVVMNGFSGVLSDEKDIGSLARSIEYFYRMPPEEYRKISRNARKHVTDNYDLRYSGEKLLGIYKLQEIYRNPK